MQEVEVMGFDSFKEKAYPRTEIGQMFNKFPDLKLKTVDPDRSNLPTIATAINQRLIALQWGFLVVFKVVKGN
jgi:hypothetical protein